MKKIVYLLIIFCINQSIAGDSSKQTYTGPPDYHLIPDNVVYDFSKPKMRIEIAKDLAEDRIKSFELEVFGCMYLIRSEYLKKIISPELLKLEVRKAFDKNKITLVLPFYYYSKTGDYPSDPEYSLKDNYAYFSVEQKKYEFSFFLEENKKELKISEAVSMECELREKKKTIQ